VGGRGRLTGTFAAGITVALLAAGPATAAPGAGPYNEPADCIRTNISATLVPPTAGQSFEVRRRPGVSAAVGTQIQNDLLSHDVQARLNAGLGSNPLGFPPRPVPIYLVPGKFDDDGDEGVTEKTCSDGSVEAIVSRTDDAPIERASTAAHELFHAYSAGVPPTSGRPRTTWWEEAAATWSEQKNGFNEQSQFDNPEIQLPERALSDRTRDHEYAMWRFLQFLDDRGYMGPVGGSWPLVQEVISGYGTVNQTLEAGLKSRGTTLADELAMFWGDRLKAQPMHGPALRPTELRTVKVEPGTTTVVPKAGPLKTWYKSYKVGNDVKRVTFHFEPNGNAAEGGQTWAAPSATESRLM